MLEAQTRRKNVEILCLLDNKIRTVGSKRNALVKIAQGDYLTFVDDDDRVSPNYVRSILQALEQKQADLVVFDVSVRGYAESHGLSDRICKYDIAFQNTNLPNEYRRQPNHIMVWRSAIAKSVAFPDVSRGEDTAWAKSILHRYKSLNQVKIAEVLYHYDFNPRGSETSSIRPSNSPREKATAVPAQTPGSKISRISGRRSLRETLIAKT